MNFNELIERRKYLQEMKGWIIEDYKQRFENLKQSQAKDLDPVNKELEEINKEAIEAMQESGMTTVNTKSGQMTLKEYDYSKPSNWSKVKLDSMEKKKTLNDLKANAPQYIVEEVTEKPNDKAIKEALASGELIATNGVILNAETGEVICDEIFKPKETGLQVK